MKPKVLIIEFDAEWLEIFRTILEDNVEVLQAQTPTETWEKLKENPDLRLITISTNVPTAGSDMSIFVKNVRKLFPRDMIATSIKENALDALIKAGCNLSVLKERLPDKILEVIGS